MGTNSTSQSQCTCQAGYTGADGAACIGTRAACPCMACCKRAHRSCRRIAFSACPIFCRARRLQRVLSTHSSHFLDLEAAPSALPTVVLRRRPQWQHRSASAALHTTGRATPPAAVRTCDALERAGSKHASRSPNPSLLWRFVRISQHAQLANLGRIAHPQVLSAASASSATPAAITRRAQVRSLSPPSCGRIYGSMPCQGSF